MSTRARSRLVFGIGLMLLIGGLVMALVAHDGSGSPSADAATQARYERLAAQAARQPPRIDATIVEIPVDELPLYTQGANGNPAYQLVDNEITRRIRTGTPSLDLDFVGLPHPKYLNRLAGFVREGKLEQTTTRVVALLVSQRTTAKVSGFSLLSVRYPPRPGYQGIVDPTDVTAWDHKRATTKGQPTVLDAWTPQRGTEGALVPLFLMHYLGMVPGKETNEVQNELYSVNVVVTGSRRSPRRLTLERPGAPATDVSIQGAVFSPVRMDARTTA